MSQFSIKRGDTLAVFSVTLVAPSGSAQDLSGASGVTLKLKSQRTGNVVTREMDVVAAAQGAVAYTWQAEDWAEIGLGFHNVEYVVTIPAGTLTFPNDGYDVLQVRPRLE